MRATPIGPHEIAVMLNVSRQRVQQLMTQDDFPEPWARLATGRIWAAEDIAAWAEAKGRTVRDLDDRA
jgi:predicted DNA-binding transcriptional regulator AlpA